MSLRAIKSPPFSKSDIDWDGALRSLNQVGEFCYEFKKIQKAKILISMIEVLVQILWRILFCHENFEVIWVVMHFFTFFKLRDPFLHGRDSFLYGNRLIAVWVVCNLSIEYLSCMLVLYCLEIQI